MITSPGDTNQPQENPIPSGPRTDDGPPPASRFWSRLATWVRHRLGTVSRVPDDSRYRHLFDGVPMALYVSSPDGTILDANPAMAQLLGYPDRRDLLQLNAFDLFVDRDVRSSQIELIERQEIVRDYPVQLRRRDGTTIWVLDHARAVRDASGSVLYYEGSLKDVTEEKAAREELQRTYEQLRTVFAASPLAIMALDADGAVVSWNPAAERIFGWSEAEVLGRPLPVVPESAEEEFEHLHSRLLAGQRLEEVEVVRVRRDGTPIDVNVSAGPLRDARGEVIGTIAVVADISERKRAEATRRRLAEILEATPDLVAAATIDGTGIYLNPAGRRMLGIPKAAALERPIWEYHSEADRTLIRQTALPTAVREGTWSGEVVFCACDGREVPTSMVMIAHRTRSDEVDYVSVVARDLTEQKALEERVQRAQTMDAIGRLAGGIAHDFNNLLTSIIGHADLLLRHSEHEQSRRDIEEIKEAGQRAAALTSQLLAFSRRQVQRLRHLDLNEMIVGVSDRLKPMLGEHIQLVTLLESSLGAVKADPLQLEEVIVCLVENACDAMPGGGRLTLETGREVLTPELTKPLGLSRAGAYAVLTVADTGCGMDEVTRDRIFEPFFSTKKEVKGTGLGLPTVYGIVKQSGGDIWVDSHPGLGTIVKVYLPEATSESRAPAAKPPPAAARSHRRGKPTILVAEDEPAVLSLAARVLRARGYEVLEARDGLEAIEVQAGHEGPIDIVLTDIVMPRMGGPEMAGHVLEARPGTGVIYMSGYADSDDARELVADARAAFLQKPFTPSALAVMARRILDGRRDDPTRDLAPI